MCTNCCLDALKAAHRKRVDYVGPWIPEPLQIDTGSDPEADLERAQSLTTGPARAPRFPRPRAVGESDKGSLTMIRQIRFRGLRVPPGLAKGSAGRSPKGRSNP